MVTAHIDINTPTGRKIIKELDAHRKIVHIENPVPEGKNYTALDVYEKSLAKLRKYYGQEFAKKTENKFRKAFS
jgi:CRISPR/Cas system-associated protein endoribonuclease Cas2